jgi:ribosomal protein S18 acetylase RimI-like enzyme
MTSEGPQIRQAEERDFPEIAHMHYRVWRNTYAGAMTPEQLDMFNAEHWVKDVYPQMVKAGWRIWVATLEGRVAGLVIFGPSPEVPRHLEINSLYVPCDNQRHGIGGLLLETALATRSTTDAVLWCAEHNLKAQRFYEKRGFKPDGRTAIYAPAPGVQVPEVGYLCQRTATRASHEK